MVKKKIVTRDSIRVPCFSDKQRKTLLPLLNVLESLNSEDRVIVLAHLDDCTRDALSNLIALVIRSSHIRGMERALLKNELEPYKNNIKYLVDSRFKNKKKKKDHLIKIGGGPLLTVLQSGIPILLRLFR